MAQNVLFELDDAPRRPADELRRIARYQRWVVAIMITQIALWVGYFILTLARGDSPGQGLGWPVRITFLLGAVGGIFTFLLYWTTRGPVPALTMGLGAIPPCMGMLVMIVVNANATSLLRSHGVRVGLFFGALEADIDDDYEDDDETDAGW